MTITINGTDGITTPEVTLDNTSADGGQVVLKSSGYSNWNLDNYSGRFRAYYNSTEYFTVTNSGNVGIGTSSPENISNYPSVTAAGKTTSSGGLFTTQNSDGTSKVRLYTDGTQGVIGTVSNQAFTFITNATERARIDTSGNLLVGTTTAANSAMLCVAGTVSASFTGRMYSLGTYNNTTGSAANLHIASDGHFFRSTSSIKYKKDVQDASHGLSEVMALRPVTYKGKSEADGDTVFGGLIAEEVHAAGLTEFVQYAEDGTPDALAYGNMVSLCIKAIQELKAIVDEQAAKITALENK